MGIQASSPVPDSVIVGTQLRRGRRAGKEYYGVRTEPQAGRGLAVRLDQEVAVSGEDRCQAFDFHSLAPPPPEASYASEEAC
jgi:hypothetical protein